MINLGIYSFPRKVHWCILNEIKELKKYNLHFFALRKQQKISYSENGEYLKQQIHDKGHP
jgi:hypothetical protein